MNEWVSEWMNEWMNGWMYAWTHESMNELWDWDVNIWAELKIL